MRFCLMLRLVGSMISGLEMVQVGSLGSVCCEILSSCVGRGIGLVIGIETGLL